MLCIVDPCSSYSHVGWPLRNILSFIVSCLRTRLNSNRQNFRILSYREDTRSNSCHHSCILDLVLPLCSELNVAPELHRTFFERNHETNKLSPRFVDLSRLMNPLKLAESAADLNLKLMLWRRVPSLQLARLQSTKCLLFGAGTLGCHVARLLIVSLLYNRAIYKSKHYSFPMIYLLFYLVVLFFPSFVFRAGEYAILPLWIMANFLFQTLRVNLSLIMSKRVVI